MVASSRPQPHRGFTSSSLNPLHCGAVVASRPGTPRRAPVLGVLIPFIAGQWSLQAGEMPVRRGGARVLIPFIAGQWSLRSKSARATPRRSCFNPLHCGAVVASRSWTRPPTRRSGLNPLHCGAVVASAARAPTTPSSTRVSIPFIAGQWSLLRVRADQLRKGLEFQSPSLRGSGRFAVSGVATALTRAFQSPSLRGSGRFRARADLSEARVDVSQSPSLRGSGRFRRTPTSTG